ncbi:hypothetical protein [Cupriavidus sp. CuC1]|uniref:hypothetical protein n=1 Tax=Cupriavidus sp. CuC1 TaxID=3373131 RepID=UPI0037D14829
MMPALASSRSSARHILGHGAFVIDPAQRSPLGGAGRSCANATCSRVRSKSVENWVRKSLQLQLKRLDLTGSRLVTRRRGRVSLALGLQFAL